MLKNANKQNITYESISDKAKLTGEDKKILTLAKKIEEDKNVVKELKKFSNIQEILMIEIVRKCEDQKEKLTLLQHALLYSHKATLEYIIKEAELYKLFEKISDKKIVLERLDGHGNLIDSTYSTVVYEDGIVKRKTLKPRGEAVANNGTITADNENSKKVLNLNIINQGTAIVDILTGIKSCESDEEEIQNIAVSTEQEPNASDSTFSKPCFDSNAVGKEGRPLTKVKQQRKVIKINPKLKEELTGDLVWEEECKDSLNTLAIEYKNAIDFVPSIGDSEAADNQLICEKSATASTETSNASNDLPSDQIKPCDAVKEKPSIKITQQRQAILAGFIGTALLAASVALCILEMHVVAVACGIVGLVCMGFALYSILKPSTKLEKVESIEQPACFESKVMLKNS